MKSRYKHNKRLQNTNDEVCSIIETVCGQNKAADNCGWTVLRRCLNVMSDGDDVTVAGRLFHARAAATVKACRRRWRERQRERERERDGSTERRRCRWLQSVDVAVSQVPRVVEVCSRDTVAPVAARPWKQTLHGLHRGYRLR